MAESEWDVLAIGGGNAVLCAALMAWEAGVSVLLLESAPKEWREGDSEHIRNLRSLHEGPQHVLIESYTEEEFRHDLWTVTGGRTAEHLARIAIRTSSTCRAWMRQLGVRFYDGGEAFCTKRHAIRRLLVAQQPGQIGYSIIDVKARGHFMPPVFPGVTAYTLPAPARELALNEDTFVQTVHRYSVACRGGAFDHAKLDDCRTEGLTLPETDWAPPGGTPQFQAYALRPGITFTYLGVKADQNAAGQFNEVPSRNLFAAGEIMAGNILGQGYTAGVGMSIGTAFGRIVGVRAAAVAKVPLLRHQPAADLAGDHHAAA